MREQLECMGCCLGMDEKLVEISWVRIKKRTGKVEEALYRQTGTASPLQVLVLTGDFNHLSISWKDSTAGHNYSRRF